MKTVAQILSRCFRRIVSDTLFPLPMIKLSPISPLRARVKPLSRLAFGFTLGYTSLASLALTQLAGAQNAPVAPIALAPNANVAAPAIAASAPDISVLIIALDDLGAPEAGLVPLFAAPTAPIAPATPPAATAPIAPTDETPAIVTPANFDGPLWKWQVLAQKKTKAQKKREEDEENAKLFNLNPVSPTPYKVPGRTNPLTNPPNVGVVPGAVPNTVPNEGGQIVRAPDAPLAGPGTIGATPASDVPGRSQLMAVPLRRILLAQGYKNVQVVTPESNAIVRAIGENRLSSRVLDELRRSLATLSANAAAGAPADISATIVAGRAASRIGQATGYRAVVGFYVADPTAVSVVGAGAAPDAKTQKVAVNMVVADAQRESVEPLQLVETGDSEDIWRETGAASGAQLLETTLRDWPATSLENRPQLAMVHFDAARAALESGDYPRAQDELNQSLSLDSSRADAYLLRGDILNAIEPGNGYTAYQKAVELNSKNGQDWARIASAYAYAKTPDWRAAWNAGTRALALNYDSAALRVAIATAQYGRADLFRKADYPGQAEEAEADARNNLERALQLAPDDPTAVRLLAKNLIDKRHYEEAARTLDRIAPRYPNDLEIQGQYAAALVNQIGREEDAFAAYARVWKLSGQKNVPVDAAQYRTLASGFDQRLFNLGKLAMQLSRGVASRAVLRETALLQLSKLKEEMDAAKDAINIMQPTGVSATVGTSRSFAASLMDQALEEFQGYLDTGQVDYYTRGEGLYRTAIASLNTARGSQ